MNDEPSPAPDNPYASPTTGGGATADDRADPAEEFAPCPRCQGVLAKRVGYTWWGGWLGPKMFCHVKCVACNTGYNGRTGRSNRTAITVYWLACLAFGVVVGLALSRWR